MTNKNEYINIIYSAVVREKHTILSEYTECSGNFSQIITVIMTEIIMKFESAPDVYRTYFYYGKYCIFLIKYQKIYIIIMFPNVKIRNNEIIFALLYSIFEELKKDEKINFEKIKKMKAYSLSNFAEIFKQKINLFYSNNSKFIPFLKKSNEFNLFEPFDDRQFESQIQLPILSNKQVHKEINEIENNNNEDFDGTIQPSNSVLSGGAR